MAGPLALVGGDEFHPGNEPQDSLLRDAAAGRPAYIIATAARDNPAAAVRTAQQWFATLGTGISELRVRSRTEAGVPVTEKAAEEAGLLYLCGGDPGRVIQVLRDTPVWRAMLRAWRGGAALAGSSAGAMALCQWSLVRGSFPGRTRRRPVDGLDVVQGCALLPHFDTFGERWIPSAQETIGRDALLLGVDERTAAVWVGGTWTAMGPGSVTLVRGDERTISASGARIDGLPQPSV